MGSGKRPRNIEQPHKRGNPTGQPPPIGCPPVWESVEGRTERHLSVGDTGDVIPVDDDLLVLIDDEPAATLGDPTGQIAACLDNGFEYKATASRVEGGTAWFRLVAI